jgi:hypothetical protein
MPAVPESPPLIACPRWSIRNPLSADSGPWQAAHFAASSGAMADRKWTAASLAGSTWLGSARATAGAEPVRQFAERTATTVTTALGTCCLRAMWTPAVRAAQTSTILSSRCPVSPTASAGKVLRFFERALRKAASPVLFHKTMTPPPTEIQREVSKRANLSGVRLTRAPCRRG